MVQRKDTMAFADLIRGIYPDEPPEAKHALLETYFSELTCEEREKLHTWSFPEIWEHMWVSHGRCYHAEFLTARCKFQRLDVRRYLRDSVCRWSQPEFGFAKGRRNLKETGQQCAVREFCEETGYARRDFRLLEDEPPIEENFLGTNGKAYRHVYYLAEIANDVGPPRLNKSNIQQIAEIGNVGWFTLEQCMAIIRPYDEAKKELLERVHAKLRDRCGCVSAENQQGNAEDLREEK
jgi:8-oxo-dGTP pyrophosphatase MutT (NUDIX family)